MQTAKQKRRERRIQQQVENFLAHGGQITICDHAASGQTEYSAWRKTNDKTEQNRAARHDR